MAVNLDNTDRLWMQILADLLPHALPQNDDAGDLQTAARRAGAGADKHQEHQNSLGKRRPYVKIDRTVARCRNDGSYLEKRVMERLKRRREIAADINRNEHRRYRDDDQIPAHLFHLERLLLVLAKVQIIIGVEVDAEQDHENCQDCLLQHCVVGCTGITHAEAAGAGRAESHTERIEQRHLCDQKQNNLHQRHAEIDQIQDLRRFLDLGHKLAERRSRAFRAHELRIVSSGHRHNRKHEDNDAHAADPVCETSPEKTRVRKRLHIFEDTRSGCCKTGNCLKKRVCERGDISVYDKRQRADNADQNPA